MSHDKTDYTSPIRQHLKDDSVDYVMVPLSEWDYDPDDEEDEE